MKPPTDDLLPGRSTTQVDNYQVSSLVRYFYQLPRYNKSFDKITNVTLVNYEEYGVSLALYGGAILALASALALVLIVFCLCRCCFASSKKPIVRSKPPKHGRGGGYGEVGNGNEAAAAEVRREKRSCCWLCSPSTMIIVVLSVACTASFVISWVGHGKFAKGVKSTCSTTGFVYDTMEDINNQTSK